MSDIAGDNLLVASLDAWPNPSIAGWYHAERLAGVSRFSIGAEHWLAGLGSANGCSWLGDWSKPPGDSLSPIESLKAYWQLNMNLVSGVQSEPLPYGFEAEPGVWVASNCEFDRGR